MNKVKPKKCRACGDSFTPMRTTQIACGIQCAIKHAQAVSAKKDRRETREAKAKLKTRQQWMKEAQVAFNKWVRMRDADRPCISCGTTQAKWDAGHYRSVGSTPALRFEPLNNHKQCAQCNQHKSGNAIEYRIGLVSRIGQANVDYLEGPHEAKNYTVDDLKAIKAHYTAQAKQLLNDGASGPGWSADIRPAGVPSPFSGELKGE